MERERPDPATLQNLCDAGCDEETLRAYCALEARKAQSPTAAHEQLRLLRQYRRALLGELHVCQEKLDCLDYLIYRLRCDCGEGGGRK